MNGDPFELIPNDATWAIKVWNNWWDLEYAPSVITKILRPGPYVELYSLIAVHRTDITPARADGAHQPCIGIVIEEPQTGVTMKVQHEGPVTNTAWTLVPGTLYWLSTTDYNTLTDVKPAQNAQLIGFGYDEHTLYLLNNLFVENSLTMTTTSTTTTTSSSSSSSTTSTKLGWTTHSTTSTSSTTSTTTTTSPYQFEDGFEANNFALWDTSVFSLINSKAGDIGSYCAFQQGRDPSYPYRLGKYLASAQADITISFRFLPYDLYTDKLIVSFTKADQTHLGLLRSGATDNTKIEACMGDKTVLGSTETGILSTSNWIEIELIFKPSTTNGIFQVRVNDHTLINVSGVATSTLDDLIARVYFGKTASYYGMNGYYDQVVFKRYSGWISQTSSSSTTTSSSSSTTTTTEE